MFQQDYRGQPVKALINRAAMLHVDGPTECKERIEVENMEVRETLTQVIHYQGTACKVIVIAVNLTAVNPTTVNQQIVNQQAAADNDEKELEEKRQYKQSYILWKTPPRIAETRGPAKSNHIGIVNAISTEQGEETGFTVTNDNRSTFNHSQNNANDNQFNSQGS